LRKSHKKLGKGRRRVSMISESSKKVGGGGPTQRQIIQDCPALNSTIGSLKEPSGAPRFCLHLNAGWVTLGLAGTTRKKSEKIKSSGGACIKKGGSKFKFKN